MLKLKILEAIRLNEGFSTSEILREIKYHGSMHYKHLKELQDEGLIHRKGNTSAARWYYGEDSESRNWLICALNSLSKDMKKIAARLEEFSPEKTIEMRIAANNASNWAENLKENYHD